MNKFFEGFEKRAFPTLSKGAINTANARGGTSFSFGRRGGNAASGQAQQVARGSGGGGSRGGPNISTANANAMRSAFGG